MEHYAGIDVSLESASLCVVDATGRIVREALPSFRGFDSPKSYATWPVWSGSTTAEIKQPKVVKEAVIALYHKARSWNAAKQTAGRYGGTLGNACMRVLECLI